MPASTGMAPKADREHLYFGKNGQDPDILAAYNALGQRRQRSPAGQLLLRRLRGHAAHRQPGRAARQPRPGTGGGDHRQPQPGRSTRPRSRRRSSSAAPCSTRAGDLGANGCASDADTALNGVTPSGSQINNYPSSSNVGHHRRWHGPLLERRSRFEHPRRRRVPSSTRGRTAAVAPASRSPRRLADRAPLKRTADVGAGVRLSMHDQLGGADVAELRHVPAGHVLPRASRRRRTVR